MENTVARVHGILPLPGFMNGDEQKLAFSQEWKDTRMRFSLSLSLSQRGYCLREATVHTNRRRHALGRGG